MDSIPPWARGRLSALGPQLATGLGGAAWAGTGLLAGAAAWGLFVFGAILIALGGVWGWKAQEVRAREAEAAQERADQAMARYREAAAALQLEEAAAEVARSIVSNPEVGWRLSLYRLDPAREIWVRVLRRASDVRIEEGGRIEVPMDKSYLRRLMSRDLTASVPQVDLSGQLPAEDVAWTAIQQEMGYSPAEVALLRMQSRRYGVCAMRLEGREAPTIGAVVEVSSSPGVLEEIQLRRVFSKPTMVLLGALMTAREVVDSAHAAVSEKQVA